MRQRWNAMARAAGQAGQGTVEYVALILLVAMLMAAVVSGASAVGTSAGIAKKISEEIKGAIDSVKPGGK